MVRSSSLTRRCCRGCMRADHYGLQKGNHTLGVSASCLASGQGGTYNGGAGLPRPPCSGASYRLKFQPREGQNEDEDGLKDRGPGKTVSLSPAYEAVLGAVPLLHELEEESSL
eukprot:jgi/Mesen1/5852/ME000298S05135